MKAKMKKFIPVLLSVMMCGTMFAGCTTTPPDNGDDNGDNPPAHTTHDYDYKDETDTQHRKTCKGCTEVNELENHKYTGDNDTTCDDCGHERTVTPVTPKPEEPENPTPTTSTPLPAGKKIYVVGDSTVCSFNDNYYLPRYGYGTQLAEYLNVAEGQIVNYALSGRSSKSFLTESNYTTLKTSIAEGDYLIIGFGHNDEKSDDKDRFTSPVGDKDTAGSFQNSLYINYVKMAQDKGATPILCTPITRYDAKGEYTGSKVHVTADGDYVKAIKDLGEATDTTVIDLTALTVAEYKKDNAAAIYYHAHTSYEEDPVETVTGNETPAGRDDTHINKYGAKMVAYQFANALKATDSTLKAHIKDGIAAPTKEVDYLDAVSKSYVKPDYKPFDPANTTATNLTGDWYATKMGKLGTDDSTCSATYANDTFTVGETDVKSKFESGADGFAAAFMQVDVNKNFTITASVKVKSVNSGLTNSQGGFGIMLRDDILVDTREDTLASNYVAAGLLNKKAPIFSRENGTLSSTGSSSQIKADDTHTLSITRVGQSVVVKFDSSTQTFTDFDFVARDNNYMYLCLFANRGIVVEFSNVQFTITGESQGA